MDGSQWKVSASPSLAHLIKQTALDVPHPTIPGKTLWDARNDQGPLGALHESNMTIDMDFLAEYNAREQERRESFGVGPLGSGSDYTVFLQRIGVRYSAVTTPSFCKQLIPMIQVASLDQGFGFTPTDPVYHYHSIYDSQRFQEIYADPGFYRHVSPSACIDKLGTEFI